MRDIAGFEGLYAATSCGRIWSYRNKKFLKPQINEKGYYFVFLYKNGICKKFKVHRLVACTYLPNLNNLPQVNHKDEIKEHNYLQNLEWCNSKYNNNYGTRNKRISETQINNPKKSKKIICVETGEIFPSTQEAGRKLGIFQSNVVNVLKGKYTQTGGYTFRYLEG